jgi:plasmid stability protein
MPGSLHVRNLDDELIARLKRRAARHGRSTEGAASFEKLAAELRKLTKRRKQTSSEVLLREGRAKR